MTDAPGEERALNVFADVHYYFSEPTPRPLSHRFDKGSYLYLHRNISHDGSRLEIANNVGKPEQDAFTGSLATAKIVQSHKHPTLVTVTVDGLKGHHEATSPPVQSPEHHWRLPNTDPRNEGKFLFRLHTLDIYFWTDEDAYSFVDVVGKSLRQGQLEILDVPDAYEQAMSPVVQQLETIAIQDPAYHNGQTRSSDPSVPSFSPPPSTDQQAREIPKAEAKEEYMLLPYNPAAPPAPEPIKHREKTPPPPDSETGTGLAAAAYHDETQTAISPNFKNQTSLSNSPFSHTQSPLGYASPPQQDYRVSSLSYLPPAPPAPHPSGGNANPYSGALTYSSPPQSSGSSPASQIKQSSTSLRLTPQDPKAHFYGKDLGPPDSPATEILGNSYIIGPPQPLQHLQPQYADYLETHRQSQKPEGGYSDYQYKQPQQHHKHHSHANEYDVHNQLYRPTEEEAQAKKHKHRKHSESQSGQPSGKLEQKADKVEKGVNRFFKKLEKKIG